MGQDIQIMFRSSNKARELIFKQKQPSYDKQTFVAEGPEM